MESQLLTQLDKSNAPVLLSDKLVLLYGSSNTGRLCAQALIAAGIRVDFFIDDTETKWGEKILGIEIISFEQFKSLLEQHKSVNVIISSTYTRIIYDKLSPIKNVSLFMMFDWIWPKDKEIDMLRAKHVEFAKRMSQVENLFDDEESFLVYKQCANFLNSGNSSYLFDIASPYECYFIPEVVDLLKNFPLRILDAGAHDGDLTRPLDKLGLQVEKWYCFEPDPANFEKLQTNQLKLELGNKMECIPKGLWDAVTNLSFKIEQGGTNSKIDIEGSNYTVDVTTIDTFFEDQNFNFVKMDIEGAEMMALKGGIKSIQQNRPIMALSIYHSVDDFFDIPLYLSEHLSNYRFMVRQHAVTFSETVLYCIPNDFKSS